MKIGHPGRTRFLQSRSGGSHVQKRDGAAPTIVPCARSLEVFDRVQRGAVDCAVIPIENSLAGSVRRTFRSSSERDVHIVREFRLRIVHNLDRAPRPPN